MAVAAASILARSLFLKKMEELSQEAGFELPFGGGAQATRAAEKSSSRKGENALAITPNCILPIQRISRDSSLSVFLFSNL